MKSLFMILLAFAINVSASTYQAGEFTAAGSCHFDFGYGKCSQGSNCHQYQTGWTQDVTVSARITNWAYPGGEIQYLTVDPFETGLQSYFVSRDFPDTTFPYAGLAKSITIGLRDPSLKSHLFERDDTEKRDNFVQILESKMRLGRTGTARLGRASSVPRNFCAS